MYEQQESEELDLSHPFQEQNINQAYHNMLKKKAAYGNYTLEKENIQLPMQAKEFKEDLFDFDSQPSNFNFAGANKLRFKEDSLFSSEYGVVPQAPDGRQRYAYYDAQTTLPEEVLVVGNVVAPVVQAKPYSAVASAIQQQQQQQLYSKKRGEYLFDAQLEEQEAQAADAEATRQRNEIQEFLQTIDAEHDSEDEGITDYKVGGYHPVHVGEVINGRYVMIQKIGWGHFSTVWLAKDFKFGTYVALKIQKSAAHYLEAAYDEVEILQKVARKCQSEEWIERLKTLYKEENKKYFTKDDCQVVQLLNSFIYRGPYGNHFCFVFEILGVNLLEVIKRYSYQGVPMALCRKIAQQVLTGLDFLHRYCSVIHTDLKPENVLLQLTQEEIRDIVENGQLTKTQLFADRVKYMQEKFGLTKKAPVPVVQKSATTESQVVQIQKQQQPQAQIQVPEAAPPSGAQKAAPPSNAQIAAPPSSAQKAAPPTEKKYEYEEGMTKNQKKKLKKKLKKQQYNEKQAVGNDVQSTAQEQLSTANTTSRCLSGDVPNQEEPKQELPKQQEPKQEEPKQEEGNGDVQQDVQNLFNRNQKFFDKTQGKRGPLLNEQMKLKIADLGNACWLWHHFAHEIQTRQYRSPEVIIRADYNATADLWSLACMMFEMLTGDFLFEPRKGPSFSKNEDHLAQIEELCGQFPKNFSLRGQNSKRYFKRNGDLKHIPKLHFWPLKNVLIEKYKFKESEAQALSDFLMPMLRAEPEKRATAAEMLNSPWLYMQSTLEGEKMSEEEHRAYLLSKRPPSAGTEEAQFAQEAGGDTQPLLVREPRLPDSDQDYGDNEDNGGGEGERPHNAAAVGDDDDDENDDKFYGYEAKYDIKLVDRSFTNLGYIGFGEGIDLQALDNTGNWQFENVQ